MYPCDERTLKRPCKLARSGGRGLAEDQNPRLRATCNQASEFVGRAFGPAGAGRQGRPVMVAERPGWTAGLGEAASPIALPFEVPEVTGSKLGIIRIVLGTTFVRPTVTPFRRARPGYGDGP